MTEPAVLTPAVEELPHCSGVTGDGEVCGAPARLLRYDDATDSWWCIAHDPDPAVRERHKLATTRGGLATSKRFHRGGLDPGELGPLQTAEDVMRRSGILSEAVATGRLTPQQGNTAIRADQLWLQAHEQHLLVHALRELLNLARVQTGLQ